MNKEDIQLDGVRDGTYEVNSFEQQVNTYSKHRYAGFWMRFWAFLADLLVVFSINSILLTPFPDTMLFDLWSAQALLRGITFFVYFLMMTKLTSQTLGKMIFGLKVVRTDGKPLQWSDLLFREVIVRFCYKIFTILNVLYVIVAFHKNKQGIHDLVAQTYVVHSDE